MPEELSDEEIWALGEKLGREDTHYTVKPGIADKLSRTGVRAIPALFHALSVSTTNTVNWRGVRDLTEEALFAMGKEAIEPLKTYLKDNPTSFLASGLLVEMGGNQVIEAIIEAFRNVSAIPTKRAFGFIPYDEHRNGRLHYLSLLSSLNDKRAIPILKEVADRDRSSRVRGEAYEALQKIKRLP